MGAVLKRAAVLAVLGTALALGSCSLFTPPRTRVLMSGIRWDYDAILRINAWIHYRVEIPYAEGLGNIAVHFDVYDMAGHVYRVSDIVPLIEQGEARDQLFGMDWDGLYAIRAVEPVKAVVYPQTASLPFWEIRFRRTGEGIVADTHEP